MPVDRAYVAENQAQLARLRTLVDTLSDQELAAPMPAGWTVAGVLAHLAFWDERIVVLMDRWGKDGRGTPPPTDNGASVDWINDAGKVLCLALPPRAAARLAVAAAEAADARAAQASEALLVANAAAGSPLSMRRAEHRREHLDEIEQVRARR